MSWLHNASRQAFTYDSQAHSASDRVLFYLVAGNRGWACFRVSSPSPLRGLGLPMPSRRIRDARRRGLLHSFEVGLRSYLGTGLHPKCQQGLPAAFFSQAKAAFFSGAAPLVLSLPLPSSRTLTVSFSTALTRDVFYLGAGGKGRFRACSVADLALVEDGLVLFHGPAPDHQLAGDGHDGPLLARPLPEAFVDFLDLGLAPHGGRREAGPVR